MRGRGRNQRSEVAQPVRTLEVQAREKYANRKKKRSFKQGNEMHAGIVTASPFSREIQAERKSEFVRESDAQNESMTRESKKRKNDASTRRRCGLPKKKKKVREGVVQERSDP